MKRSTLPNLAITKRRKLSLHSNVLEEITKKIPTEKDSDAFNFDGEVTECIDKETDSENDMEDNPVYEECSNSVFETNVYNIHPFNL
ncbi:hypothetical protein AVEN_108324-1 [Araneus ventricosus]|uniref:Uncharacterized protein n=1 Tax=Araneus ventricosus TaxID=182803 RepID=A0A4Y2W8G3_ARAVE|nr:hypothetical protein AVEN_103500-1 [Araneus ventricosus]GBO33302.1 hypothetical protein AVEN_108324-1 [Araneus ventricosus]